MRILVAADVSPVVVRGGGERALVEMASGLRARGHTVHMVCRAADGVEAPVVHGGIPVSHFTAAGGSLPALLRASLRSAQRAVDDEVAAHGADVLHLHQPLAGLGALRSRAGRRLPSLYTFHSPAPLEYRARRGTSPRHRGGAFGAAGAALLWAIERAALARATRIHVLSRFSESLLWRLYRIRGERVVRIPGGTDLARFTPPGDRDAVRRALGLPGDRPVLVTVRNLEPRMGLDNLLVAVDRARREAPDVLLLVGGAGSQQAALEAIVTERGLGEHVRFLGFVPEATLPALYGAADAFVLPTRALEGFGLATVEALACGTPVLGTPVGATPEILGPIDPGLVFRDAGPAAIAEGLIAFLARRRRDPEGARRLREGCRRHAERYGWPRAVTGLERVLADLATAASPTAASGAGCVACGGPETGRWRRHGDHRVCPRCGTATREAQPEAGRLRAYYEDEYAERFAPEVITAARARFLSACVDRLGVFAERGRLVDVGCSGGHLLRVAAERGWRAVGTDVSHTACVAAAKAVGRPVVQADGGALPLADGAVQAVTMVNVLDHLRAPEAALVEAGRVLGDGGIVLIRVPNGAFHRAAGRWIRRLGPLASHTGLGRMPVMHLYAFTPRGLRRLVERAGFRVLEVRNSVLVAEPDDRREGARAWLAGGLATGARVVALASAGRLLAAPSIEVYARRERR